jgi:hypothetical protein
MGQAGGYEVSRGDSFWETDQEEREELRKEGIEGALSALRSGLAEALDFGSGATDDEQLIESARGFRERMDALDAEEDKWRETLAALVPPSVPGMRVTDDHLRRCAAEAFDLVERAVRNARQPGPRWCAVKATFALGSTRATELCRRFGLDPDEEFPHPEDEEPTCESGLPDCGPATASDSEGVPLCERCFRELAAESVTQGVQE